MTTVFVDSDLGESQRRDCLYRGDLFVFSSTETTRAFCEFARGLIACAFGGLDPETAQYQLDVREFARILGELKPTFIHHPESKRFIQKILVEAGCDVENTFFEVPKLRSSTSDGYLTAGIAYAWHPHRDTWYSAPQCQVNWWLPIYDIEPGNAMSFHTVHWDQAVPNSSSDYNYYVWNREHRGGKILEYINEDPRPLPRATTPVHLTPEVRVVCPPGGMLLFSGAHLHSSVPNQTGKTRFSLDFRTVNRADLLGRHGAPNLDSHSTGTVLREFRRAKDLSECPEDVLALYQDGTEALGAGVYANEPAAIPLQPAAGG